MINDSKNIKSIQAPTVHELQKMEVDKLFKFSGQVSIQDEANTNSRPIDLYLIGTSEEFNRAVDSLAKRFEHEDRPSHRDKLRRNLNTLLANLYLAHCQGVRPYVAYSRNSRGYEKRYCPSGIGFRPLVQRAADGLIALEGLVEDQRGIYGGDAGGEGYLSRLRATMRLVRLLESHGVNQAMIGHCPEVPEVIVLKDGRREIDYDDTDQTRRMRDLIQRYNARLAKTSLTLSPAAPANVVESVNFANTQVRRIFNNGSFRNGGRLYGGWWQDKKDARPFILIDGSPTVEMDFQAMSVHQLYARNGLSYADVHGAGNDPYSLPELPTLSREIAKLAFRCIVNTPSNPSAVRAFGKGLREQDLFLDREKTPVKFLFAQICSKHSPIANFFYTSTSTGVMFEESEILCEFLSKMLDDGLVPLSIHDSVIVPVSTKDLVLSHLNDSWKVIYPGVSMPMITCKNAPIETKLSD